MDIISSIRSRAKNQLKTIVLPRSSDERVIKAAEFLTRERLCRVVLIENEETLTSAIPTIKPESYPKFEEYALVFHDRRKHKGLTSVQALEMMKDPLYFAASMVAAGDADGCVAGSVSTTGMY